MMGLMLDSGGDGLGRCGAQPCVRALCVCVCAHECRGLDPVRLSAPL